MKILSPEFIELTQDACLKAFWRKGALRRFLQQNRIPESFLATWHADETKRIFLNRLFEHLIKKADNEGHKIILEIANTIADMEYFPDLEGWEDSSVKISDAKKAVARLASKVKKLNQQISDEKEKEQNRRNAAKKREAAKQSQETLSSFTQELDTLAQHLGQAEAGYKFEDWFYRLTLYFELEGTRPSYRAGSREIDGSFTIEGTTFLIETKFTKAPTGSPDIDIFMAKIESKADNTMGIFISMAGFKDEAKKAASKNKTPMLLMDYNHIYSLILHRQIPLPDVIKRIKRHASQEGSAYLPMNQFST